MFEINNCFLMYGTSNQAFAKKYYGIRYTYYRRYRTYSIKVNNSLTFKCIMVVLFISVHCIKIFILHRILIFNVSTYCFYFENYL